MSELRQATVYALESSAPMNLGAGVGTDRIRKAFCRLEAPVACHLTIEVGMNEYEALVKALIQGSKAETTVDPARVTALQIDDQGGENRRKAEAAIASVRERSGTPQ